MPPTSKSPAPPSFYNKMAEMAPSTAGSASTPEKSPEGGADGGDLPEIVAKMIMVVEKLAKMGKEVEPYAKQLNETLQALDMNVIKKGGAGMPGNAPPPPPASPGPAPAAAGGSETQPVPA